MFSLHVRKQPLPFGEWRELHRIFPDQEFHQWKRIRVIGYVQTNLITFGQLYNPNTFPSSYIYHYEVRTFSKVDGRIESIFSSCLLSMADPVWQSFSKEVLCRNCLAIFGKQTQTIEECPYCYASQSTEAIYPFSGSPLANQYERHQAWPFRINGELKREIIEKACHPDRPDYIGWTFDNEEKEGLD